MGRSSATLAYAPEGRLIPEAPETLEKPSSSLETPEKPCSPLVTPEKPCCPLEMPGKPHSPPETPEKPCCPLEMPGKLHSPPETPGRRHVVLSLCMRSFILLQIFTACAIILLCVI